MRNKKILFTFIYLITNFVSAQDSKEDLMNTNILIDRIDVKIHRSAVFIKNPDKELSNVILYRQNAEKSHLIKKYQSGREEDNFLIDTFLFDLFVVELKKLDIEKIDSSYDSNIYDGKIYYLQFGNSTYTINAGTNNPQIDTEKRGLTAYLKLCNSIWDLGK